MKPKVGDFFIIFIVIMIAVANLALFLNRNDGSGAVAQIIKDGEIIKTIDLEKSKDERIEFIIEGKYFSKIVAIDGKIHFEESNCPDRTCVRTGWISNPGQTAACVYSGVIIKIVGDSMYEDTDIIAG